MIGLGYIGLPTAAVFASKKVNVIGVDVNQYAVDTINRQLLLKKLMLSSWQFRHHLKEKIMNQI